jgi:glycosyltransferase involved in cell wall biosynthesis
MISVVIPLYNEEDSLPELFDSLEAVMAGIGDDYEYVFVDDGSVDKSLLILRELYEKSPHVRVTSFRRNHGKSAALSVGFKEAVGDIIITIDADLQDDPAEIPVLIRKLHEGADLVSGWKKDRQDPWTKRFPSKFFNFVTSMLSGLRLHDFNCGLKAYRGDVARTISVYGELHRFIPVLAGWEGFRVDEVQVRHFRRKYGKSKYGGERFLNGFFDLVTVMFITRRALKPLHFFGRISFVLFVLGSIPQIVFLVQYLGGQGLRVRPLMLAGFVLIIVALQIGSIGLLAEMISARSGQESSYALREHLSRDSQPSQYRGGIAHYTSMLAREFVPDHKVLVINFKRLYPSFLFPGKTQFDESGEPLDIESTRLIDSMNPLSFWAAARTIKSFVPDLIVFQWWQPFFAVAYAAIFLCHNVLPHERSFLDDILIRVAFLQCNRFFVQSQEDRRNLLTFKRDAGVVVHPHPIYDLFNRGRYSKESARRELGVTGRVALFFGLIRDYKGLPVLIDAFATVVEKIAATLLIVGEFYESKASCVARIRRLKLDDQVRVVDRYVPNEEVEKYFMACDVVVLPYLSATQSGIAQIAFAFDKPVIVTNVGGLPDVVDDGVTGYVVPPKNPDALSEAIVKFFDGAKEDYMSEAVSRAKQRFSWKRCRELLIEMGEAPLPR